MPGNSLGPLSNCSVSTKDGMLLGLTDFCVVINVVSGDGLKPWLDILTQPFFHGFILQLIWPEFAEHPTPV